MDLSSGSINFFIYLHLFIRQNFRPWTLLIERDIMSGFLNASKAVNSMDCCRAKKPFLERIFSSQAINCHKVCSRRPTGCLISTNQVDISTTLYHANEFIKNFDRHNEAISILTILFIYYGYLFMIIFITSELNIGAVAKQRFHYRWFSRKNCDVKWS